MENEKLRDKLYSVARRRSPNSCSKYSNASGTVFMLRSNREGRRKRLIEQ